MGIALALISALSYGVSDVIGGLAARRSTFLRAALLGQTGGLGATVILALGKSVLCLLGQEPDA